MKRRNLIASSVIVSAGLVAVVSMAVAEPSEDLKKPGQPEMQLPPGWTETDMMACMKAGTPGKMHEHLAEGAGEWKSKTTMWMAPSLDPMQGDGSWKVTPILGGRYIMVEMNGEMPGMGPYNGLGIYGYDNVTKEFVSTWVDDHGTGIGTGTGKLSDDGKTLTWEFTYNCPITEKPTVMREIDRITGPDTRTLEMFGKDPKSGKEFKMMVIELKRTKSGAQAKG